MIFDLDELDENSLLKDQNCFIIATAQAPINYLLWSVFSILIRSKSFTDHIIFAINGPDKRTGDPWIQDTKQRFLEVLRDQYYGDVTINRVWSRIGHSQSVESVLPWVHTEFYTLAHDDIILLDPDWGVKCLEKFRSRPEVALCATPPLMFWGSENLHEGGLKLGMPHINSAFVCCRKCLTSQCGARWWGHHIKKKFRLSEGQYSCMMEELGDWFKEKPSESVEYDYYNTDIGTWMLYSLKQAGFKFVEMEEPAILHFVAASWTQEETRKQQLEEHHLRIQELEYEINNSKYAKIYNDFKEDW